MLSQLGILQEDKKEMSLTIQVLSCRWCGHKVIPKLDTGLYPKKCPNNSCRRQTWNKSDQEIKASAAKRIEALFQNHKDGKVGRKRSYKPSEIKFLNNIKNIKPKQFVCLTCELLFGDLPALQRHQERRGHK